MGIGAYILGGALQGAGQGMAMRQKVADEERRDQALSALRRGELDLSYKMQGENQAAHDQREASTQREGREDEQDFKARLATAGARADAAKQESEQAFKLREARLQSALRTNEEVAKINANARNENRQVHDVVSDEKTGASWAILKDGTEVPLKTVIQRKIPKASSSSSSLFGDEGEGLPGTTGPKTLDDTPTTEAGFTYKPGPGGRANPDNWTKR